MWFSEYALFPATNHIHNILAYTQWVKSVLLVYKVNLYYKTRNNKGRMLSKNMSINDPWL